MAEVPSKHRCYPVEYCAECQGRLPMRHLYKPYGMMSHHNIVDVDSEFANRWVCTETDDNREIKLHPSLDFPDWCPLKVIPDGLDMTSRQQEIFGILEQLVFVLHCYEQDVLDPDFPAPSKHTDMMQQAENLLAQIKTKESWFERHDAAVRNAVLDELGILHGEDAKRFNEQLDHPEPLTPEARDLVMQAQEIAQAARKEKGCPYWNPDANIYPDEPENHCTCRFSDIRKNEREKVLREKCLELAEKLSPYFDENYPLYVGPPLSPAGQALRAVMESLRPTTPAPDNRDYQCGDNCHGECSGEYDGKIHCPESEPEKKDSE